jgi:hypothetical protein
MGRLAPRDVALTSCRRRTAAMSGRFKNLKPGEGWGYFVWGLGALVVVIPEFAAAFGNHVPWPTISATVGHLETRWNWVALIVVAIIVWVAFHVARFPVSREGPFVEQIGGRNLGRTEKGRLTRVPERGPARGGELSIAWLIGGMAVVSVASLATGVSRPGNKFLLAYVLYGSTALIFIVAPSILAIWFAKDVPFPTFFRTLSYVSDRVHFAAVLIVIGLVILLIHLALYPWPDIFDRLRPPAPSAP